MLDKKSWKDSLTKAENEDSDAQYEVGWGYAFGQKTSTGKTIVEQNLTSAFYWYEKASQNGNVEATTNVADFLSEGKGCKIDIPKAIQYYKLAIEKGSGRAAFNLGIIYRDKEDFKKAFKYYKLADKLEKGCYALTIGLCYYYGIGVDMDKKKACKYFKIVATDKRERYAPYDIDEANYLLGRAYLLGEGVKRSLEKAKFFLQLANTDKDHTSAEHLLFIVGRGR